MFTAWLRKRNTAATANERYVRDFEGYMIEYFGDRRVNSITSVDAHDYAEWRQTNFKKKKPKNQTINREINTLRHLMTFCVKQKWLPEGKQPTFPSLPTVRSRKGADNAKVDKPETGWFTPAEYIVLRRLSWRSVVEARNEFDRVQRLYRHYLMELQYQLGCRTEEITNLRHNDYMDWSFPDGPFMITSVLITLRGSDKERTIVAPPVVRSLLAKLKVLMHQANTGKVAPVDSVNSFNRLLKQTGLYRDHEDNRRNRTSLRHTRATLELYYRRDRVSSPVLATYMGHTVLEQQRTYSKIYKILQSETLHSRGRRVGKINLATQWLRQARELMARLNPEPETVSS
jgi:site-specific recombinase XerD